MPSEGSYSSFCKERDDSRFSEWLRTTAVDQWDEMLDHRFIVECTDGSVDRDVYRAYLEQEFAFVETAAVALGHAIVNAPSFDEIRQFSEALAGLVTDQREYFERAFAKFGVEGWENVKRLPATCHLSDVVLRGATTPGYAESLAPMVAAEWLYSTWCHQAVEEGSFDPDSIVGEWIQLHDEPEFREHVRWLRTEIDRIGPTLPTDRQRDLSYLFKRTIELEIQFHTAPYNQVESG